MDRSYRIISSLADPSLPVSQSRAMLREFAQTNGWIPSFEVDYPQTQTLANGHIVVEHGLDTAAVVTFLRTERAFMLLSLYEQHDLLTISYNNLVDWHLFPDPYGLTLVNNRVDPLSPRQFSLDEYRDVWRAERFDAITKEHKTPNLKTLDEVLVETLLFWKRALAAEMGATVRNEEMSALFNALIFVRALEDQRLWSNHRPKQLLFTCWNQLRRPKTILSCLRKCFRSLSCSIPRWLLEQDKLRSFHSLSEETVLQLFRDFYKHRYIPYRYDFSLISKHALSKIYEHYVSLLQRSESPQMTLFPDLPDAERNKAVGGFYTPQYVARFFARYLKENLSPRVFRELRTVDPACGSGIFLRTILEMQCEPWQEVDMRAPTQRAFSNVLGIDVDENACHATRLSLALLYLALKRELPRNLDVQHAEAIAFFQDHPSFANQYDVVVANPPYIAWDNMTQPMQDRLSQFLAALTKGKADMYLGHLKLGFELVKPGGFLLYVLPHSFLLAKNAQNLRREISKHFLIRFLADLSEIPVFESLGSYVILLILQKKDKSAPETLNATIVRCREFPGHALQSAIEGKTISGDLHDIYQVDQSVFEAEEWSLLPPSQMRLRTKLAQFPSLEHFMMIKEGFITGADDVFVRDASDIPNGEEKIYIPYLPDRKMKKFVVPSRVSKVVFYPYSGGLRLTEDDIRQDYPHTWAYLQHHADHLKARKSVRAKECSWWSPVRPRPPENMLRPKLVSPHLILLPKFSLDRKGRFGVSRCPLLFPRRQEGTLDLLSYFLAVLNSSPVFWQISNLSHRYSRGYVMLEPKTLRKLKVPNPADVPSSLMLDIQNLVRERLSNRASERASLEKQLDGIIAGLYGLSENERAAVGMDI